jgi:hypothetical protein
MVEDAMNFLICCFAPKNSSFHGHLIVLTNDNAFNVLWIIIQYSSTNNIAQIYNVGLDKFTFLQVECKLILLQSIKHLFQMVNMVIQSIIENKNIIQI